MRFPKFRNNTPILSLLTFDAALDTVLTGAICQHKELKDILIGKEETKLLLFKGDMTVYVENPCLQKCLVDLTRMQAEYKINIQRLISSLCTCKEQMEIEIKIYHFQ